MINNAYKLSGLPCFCVGVLAFAVLLFGSAQGFGQSRINVRILPETTIENDRVDLGSISAISAPTIEADRLRAISLGYAPNIGRTREISRSQILLAVNAAGFNANEIDLISPPTVLVHRSGQSVSQDLIREAVEKAVFGTFPAEVTATIIRLDVPTNIQIPAGVVEIRANLSGIRNPFARFALPVEIRVGNKVVRTFAATVEIEAFADVFVAINDLPASSKITAADVRIEKRRLDNPISKYLRDLNHLQGAVLLREVRTGSVMTVDSISAGVVVRAGDAVRIEAQSGNIKIVINGEARAAGKIGDRIAVKNSQSGAVLQAVILNEGLVKVNF